MLTHRVFEEYAAIFYDMPFEEAVETEAGWVLEYTDLSKDHTGTRLDDWQILNLNNTARYQLYVKSRQVGFSFVQSIKKLARCALRPGYNGVFISIDRAESQNKLRYLNRAWESLDESLKTGDLYKTKDNSITVEFRNKSRCLSYPSKSPRGESEADLTFDEVAHVRNAAEKFNGATAIALHDEDASIELGSSPLSATGFFYDVANNTENLYRSFDGDRYYVHWWDSTGLCRDVYKARREAERDAWDMLEARDDVEYRVNKYGTPALIDEFYSRSTEQFRQEYECAFSSDNSALIAIKYLRECADTELRYLIYDDSMPDSENKPWLIVDANEDYVKDIVCKKVEEILYECEGETGVYVGFDPASKQHQSVITFGIGVNRKIDGVSKFKIRILGRIAFRRTPIYIQEHLLDMLAFHTNVERVCIDRTGHAIDLCDRLISKYGNNSKFEPFNFSAKVKSELGSRMQFYFEQLLPEFPYDKDLINQVYALKRMTTRTGQESVQAPESTDHHADGGWSLALMMYRIPVPEIRRETKAMTTNNKPKDDYRMREEFKDSLRRQRFDERISGGIYDDEYDERFSN